MSRHGDGGCADLSRLPRAGKIMFFDLLQLSLRLFLAAHVWKHQYFLNVMHICAAKTMFETELKHITEL